MFARTALIVTLFCAPVFAQTGGDREALSRFASMNKLRDAELAVRKPLFVSQRAPLLQIARWFNASPISPGRRATLIDFWSTNCAPCTAAFPRLAALGQHFGAARLTVVTVHPERVGVREKGIAGLDIQVTKSADAVLPRFLADRNIRLPVGVDQNGATFRNFRIDAVPTYFLVDADGIVRFESHKLPTEAEVNAVLAQ
jgi:thiol-disulfide isomerase/thioredoxin